MLTTAVKTLLIVFGSAALYEAEFVASAIVRNTDESAPEVKAIGKMRTGLPVSPWVERGSQIEKVVPAPGALARVACGGDANTYR